jgi:hypothetical protein
MRKLLSLALLGGLAWWFFGSRRESVQRTATIGYADGSSISFETGSPELERLLRIAAEATAA